MITAFASTPPKLEWPKTFPNNISLKQRINPSQIIKSSLTMTKYGGNISFDTYLMSVVIS
jgi:hypothetical protein